MTELISGMEFQSIVNKHMEILIHSLLAADGQVYLIVAQLIPSAPGE